MNLDENKIVEMYNSGLTSIEIAGNIGVSKPTILRILKKQNVKMRPNAWEKKYSFNENFFSTYTVESCYWAGFIAADGCVTGDCSLSIELNKIDENHLKKFCNIINRKEVLCYRDKIQKSGKISHLCYINLRSKQIKNDLKINFNIIPRKSLVLEPPKQMPKIMIYHFIRGYFDGDGSIGTTHKKDRPVPQIRVNIVSGSKKFLEWIKQSLKENLIIGNPNILKRKSKKDGKKIRTWSVTFGGNNQAPTVMNWLYKNCETNRLDRKHDKYDEYLKIIFGGLK